MSRARRSSFVALGVCGLLFVSASCSSPGRNFDTVGGSGGEAGDSDLPSAGKAGSAGDGHSGGAAHGGATGEAGAGDLAGEGPGGDAGASEGGASGSAGKGGTSAGGSGIGGGGGVSGGGHGGGGASAAGSGGAPPACAYTTCPSGCKNTQIDVANCGACGNACPANNACVSGACLVKDGYACVNANECQSNKCTTFYVDADGDTHGSPASPKQTCGTTPPAGYVASNDDCCDVGGDAVNIYKNNPNFYYKSTTSCNKGWDYNCSGNVEKEGTIIDSECKPNPIGACPIGIMWYASAVPECGVSGSRSACISPSGAANSGNQFCASAMPSTKVQGCH